MRDDTDMSRLRAVGLTAKQLVCLAWHHYDGVTPANIAARLGISQQGAQQLLERGRRRLGRAGFVLRPRPRGRPMRYPPLPTDPREMDHYSPCEVVGVL